MRMISTSLTFEQSLVRNRGALRFPALPNALAQAGGVYWVSAGRDLPRLRGVSPVLYVGSAKRLGQRLTPRHHILPRLAAVAAALEFTPILKVHELGRGDSPASLPVGAWARLQETHALADYQRNHLELPPLNRRSEGFVPGRAMEAMAQALTAPGTSPVRDHLSACDEAWSALTYVSLIARGRGRQPRHRPMPQLMWTWPEAWWSGDVPWWCSGTNSVGQRTPLLDADVLYFFAPVGHALAPLAGKVAHQYDFAQEGGVWVYRELTRPGWLDLTAAHSMAELVKTIEIATREFLQEQR